MQYSVVSKAFRLNDSFDPNDSSNPNTSSNSNNCPNSNNASSVNNSSNSNHSFRLSPKIKQLLWMSLGFALFARLVCSILIPLTDTTEARYGEIARKMLETGDWITPQHDYGVPFWAKPPLSTWLSAFSMKLFGINEFAVRLPSLLLGIGILMLVWQWATSQRGRDFALTACAVLASMSLFFMASGAVMTDESLTCCTTLTMISFWRAINTEDHQQNKRWGYLFFVGLGFGLLAKGLLVGVLTALPILPWVLLRNSEAGVRGNLQQVWKALPWIKGSVLMLVISLPWYIIAEHKTPGFLAYFVLGEHFGRFLNSSWSGDKYGNAHAEALGMIWVFLLMSALPWSFVLIAKLKGFWRNQRNQNAANEDGWLSYLFMWSFVPIVFFTFAHNIIWTYPLPALPAVALLIVEILRRNHRATLSARLAACSFLAPAVLLIFALLYASGHHGLLKASQKDSASYFLHNRPDPSSGLYYFNHRYYSGEFYSAGKAKAIEAEDLSHLIDNGHIDYLMIHSSDVDQLSPQIRHHFEAIHKFGNFTMLREVNPSTLITLNASSTL